jgi:hypothetical protein
MSALESIVNNAKAARLSRSYERGHAKCRFGRRQEGESPGRIHLAQACRHAPASLCRGHLCQSCCSADVRPAHRLESHTAAENARWRVALDDRCHAEFLCLVGDCVQHCTITLLSPGIVPSRKKSVKVGSPIRRRSRKVSFALFVKSANGSSASGVDTRSRRRLRCSFVLMRN